MPHYLLYDEQGNISHGLMSADVIDDHCEATGLKARLLDDSQADEMRVWHHHYKMVDGQVVRKSPQEVEEDEKLRRPKLEGPSELTQLNEKMDTLIAKMDELPDKMAAAIKATLPREWQ